MGHAQLLKQSRHSFLKCTAIIAAIFFVGSACRAQDAPVDKQPETSLTQELDKYPGLQAEFGRLFEKLRQNIQFPAARSQSRLLPLMPPSTISYAAFSNYGDVANQTLRVFRQELKESSVLRDWWAHGQVAAVGPKVEDSLGKFSQLHEYLGEEIVVSATMEGKEPSLLIVAEVRKPGLKKFLQQIGEELAEKSKSPIRVLDLQELAAAKDKVAPEELLVLVRPDFVVAAPDLVTLRSFNDRLGKGSREFVSTPFGQRISREYQAGVTVLAAADLQKILDQASPGTKQDATFQYAGFADVKYVVWEHKIVAGQAISQTELSFSAPRHGSAAWLANSRPLGSLDFVSPKSMLAGTVVLSNPAQIFEDAKQLASLSKSNAFAAITQLEQALNLSLKNDLFGTLGGELTVELINLNPPQPAWRATLGVKDSSRLQQTLNTLLAAAHFEAESVEDGGVTYHTLQIPSGKTATEIGYAFVDEYLVVGSGRDMVAEAVQLHRSGESLGKSKKFLSRLPPGHSLEASALLFEDPIAIAALQMRRLAPGMAESIAQYFKEANPTVLCVYGDDTSIREVSTNSGLDAGAVLVVAAIAIPNLLRSRIAANEASAVGSLRTVNTAQVAYAATYPKRGYAPDLASLGWHEEKRIHTPKHQYTEDHAGLIMGSLAEASCTADAWCTKSGYQFRVKAVCKLQRCEEYIVVATPASDSTGTRSFCSTSDGVIRFKLGPPFVAPPSVSECRAWTPLH